MKELRKEGRRRNKRRRRSSLMAASLTSRHLMFYSGQASPQVSCTLTGSISVYFGLIDRYTWLVVGRSGICLCVRVGGFMRTFSNTNVIYRDRGF